MKRVTIWLWGASVILAVGATRMFWAAHTGEVMYDATPGKRHRLRIWLTSLGSLRPCVFAVSLVR